MTQLRFLTAAFISLLFAPNALAQLRQINPAKLPPGLSATYSQLLQLEPMVRHWTPEWKYDTPKSQVTSLLTSSLHEVQSAVTASPQNEELLLLSGMVAHFAYNLDIENTHDTAVQSYDKAHQLMPNDYRPDWFLASLHCQTMEVKLGMEQMLAIEARLPWQSLPVDFWDDYMDCSTMTLMPAHTLRAVGHAVHLGEDPASYQSTVDIANGRYKQVDDKTTYSAREAWEATVVGKEVRFTSQLCGVSFLAHSDWHMDIRDVGNGVCTSMIKPGPYASKTGQSVPTILLMTRVAKAKESLEDFVQSLLKKYPEARVSNPASCPSDKCLGFEIMMNKMYKNEGGAHLLLVGFEEEAPEFPGLTFERPGELPKSKSDSGVKYYTTDARLHRFPGRLYTVVMLDSNASIFEKAEADFKYVLKSIQLD